ncbi:MAG: TIGR02757 family protein [Flavisolibacter sp.]
MDQKLRDFLDTKAAEYDRPAFIDQDPICIPHQFSRKQDIEIAGFFAAIFAWGNRTIIIRKTRELMERMDHQPYRFCLDPQPGDLKKLMGFRHRTFNDTDLLYFVAFLHHHYSRHESLETAFSQWMRPGDEQVEQALVGFHHYFFSLEDAPSRTRKHIATPEKGSTCKRLNMFLRWMVRKDPQGVDFGLWNRIAPAQLVCPIDVHVARVARRFDLISRKQVDWLTALELTAHLKTLDPSDPSKYDFALFGLGVIEKF